MCRILQLHPKAESHIKDQEHLQTIIELIKIYFFCRPGDLIYAVTDDTSVILLV